MIIYKITNLVNGKIYIGQTIRSLPDRIHQHLYRQETLVAKAILKYGIENFKIEQIEECDCKDDLNAREIYWIKHYDCISPKGYNRTFGGEGCFGYKMTIDDKERLINAKKRYYAQGGKHPMLGKHHTEETRCKISESRKGKSLNHCRKHSDEIKRKISENRKGLGCRKVINLNTNEIFDSIQDACKKYNLLDGSISRVCSGKYKTSGGFKWVYVN